MSSTHPGAVVVAAPHRLWWKRPLDLALGTALLLLGLPLIGALALAVAIESPGPAFFRQERVGQNGTRFRMWKLRTMLDGCPDDAHRLPAASRVAGHST